MTQMLADGRLADPEDAGDLPVGLAARRPDHALALALGELHRACRITHPAHAACRFEGEGADQLEQRLVLLGEGLARGAGEGTGAMRVARNMGGNGEAVA